MFDTKYVFRLQNYNIFLKMRCKTSGKAQKIMQKAAL